MPVTKYYNIQQGTQVSGCGVGWENDEKSHIGTIGFLNLPLFIQLKTYHFKFYSLFIVITKYVWK